ncbi:MAG: hypothetical protein R2706_17730 [Acidimicrobiales bacterium]
MDVVGPAPPSRQQANKIGPADSQSAATTAVASPIRLGLGGRLFEPVCAARALYQQNGPDGFSLAEVIQNGFAG